MKKLLLSSILTAIIFSIYSQTQIGRTRYDLQTNNAVCRRIATNPAGEITTTYTRSHQSPSDYADRGTGYNYSSDFGTTWNENLPFTSFTRADTSRTGWPNLVYTNSKEVVISHFAPTSGGGFDGIQVMRRDLGTNDSWEKTILHSAHHAGANGLNAYFGDEATWARAASNGDSIVIIFSSISATIPGFANGGLMMYKSADGGDSWQGPDLIDQVHEFNFQNISADEYSIDINSNGKIAIVTGAFQIEVLTSDDFGVTFTKTTVVKTEDIAGNPNPLFTGLSGETLKRVDVSDGAYSIVVDDNDEVHLWFGRRTMDKPVSTTANATYLVANVGLMYWNSTMSEPKLLHETRLRAENAWDGNVYIGNQWNDQPNQYGSSITSMASGAYATNGDLFFAYSGVRSLKFTSTSDNTSINTTNGGLHFSDVFLMRSIDNGANWTGPYNVSSGLMKECVYPGIPRKIYGTEVPIIWQEDELPSVELNNTSASVSHGVVENKIMFKKIDFASIVSPTDITNPTIIEIVTGTNSLNSFLNCDIDFNQAFILDDVPTGPGVLDYHVVVADMPLLTTLGTNTIHVYAFDAAGNHSDTIEVVLTVLADTEAPVATLVGPDTLYVLASATYTDPGYTVTDNSCDPTIAATASDLVNPNISVGNIGNYYPFAWIVQDNSLNADTVIRFVQIIGADIVAPVITPNNGLVVETIEANCGTTWNNAGVTAYDNIDFANLTVYNSGTVDLTSIGTYLVKDSATDAAGNTGVLIRTIEVVDNTAPSINVDFANTVLYLCKGDANINDSIPNASASDCVTSTVTLTDNRAIIQADINTAGTKTLTYTATDDAGNVSTRDVEVRIGAAAVAGFDISSQNGLKVLVTNTSENSPTYNKWSWGDGTGADFSATPGEKEYFFEGDYTISLTVSNEFGSACNEIDNTITKTVTLTASSIDELNKLNAAVNIHPNPTTGIVNITIAQENLTNVYVEVINVLGDIISTTVIANTTKNNTAVFNLGENASGIYFVNITTENARTSKKVTIK